jgi:hypothetical protein
MPLDPPAENEVRRRVIEMFGLESVTRMDFFFMELNDLRISSATSFEFLEKVKEKYTADRSELLIAALLWGMREGEIAYEYHLKYQELQRGPLVGYE